MIPDNITKQRKTFLDEMKKHMQWRLKTYSGSKDNMQGWKFKDKDKEDRHQIEMKEYPNDLYMRHQNKNIITNNLKRGI